MQKLVHDYVDTKFIACFLEMYKLSIDQIQLSDGRIGNPLLMQLIQKVYLEFLKSNQDYETWFDRQIIECNVNDSRTKSKARFFLVSLFKF